jgi:DHA2 family lincomycin resistance protein-like MFS transporter
MATVQQDRLSLSDLSLVLVMLLGAFVAILNETFLNVSLAQLSEDLGVSASTAQWLTSGYLLVIGVLVPVTAFLVQTFTTRQLFFAAMSLFSVGTLIAGLSPNFTVLLAGRLIQASGTAITLPLLMNVILALIPARNRGTAMGTLGLVILVAPAVGPTVSGWLLSVSGWRALFFSVLPISLAVLAYSTFALRNVTEQTNPRVDGLSFVLSTLGFGGVVFAASSAGEGGGGISATVTVPLGVGVVGLALFVWRQLSIKEPLLDLRTFRYGTFTLSVVTMISVMMALFASLIILPMYLQNVRGLTPLAAGAMMLPGGLVLGAMSPITGRLFDRLGVRRLAPVGLVIMLATLIGFANLATSTPYSMVVALHAGFMFGVSMVMMPVMTNGLNQLPSSLYAHGSAIVNTVQQVSAAFGTALLVTVMARATESYLRQASSGAEQAALAANQGVVEAFTVSAVLACAALVLSLFMKRVSTEETVQN